MLIVRACPPVLLRQTQTNKVMPVNKEKAKAQVFEMEAAKAAALEASKFTINPAASAAAAGAAIPVSEL